MFSHSIRWRLQLWLGFLLVCVLAGFGVTAFKLHQTNQLKKIDEELESHVAAIRGALHPPPLWPRGGPPPFEKKLGPPQFDPNLGPLPVEEKSGRREFDHERRPPPFSGQRMNPPPDFLKRERDLWSKVKEMQLPPDVWNLFGETETNGFYFAIWSPDKALIKNSTNVPSTLHLPDRLSGDDRLHFRPRGHFREAYYFGALGECVLAGRYIRPDLIAINRFALWLLIVGSMVLALGLGGGWWLTTHAIRPVEEISTAASRISAGNLSERIKVAVPENELGRLAGVLNATFARLEAAFSQQKQFTADAAHELRTPLAVLISEAQTTLARDRSAAEYRETVAACLDTAQQMRRLTESLLELARFDAGQERIRHRPVDVADSVKACLERIRPLAEERAIQIHVDLAPAKINGDADRLNQVVTNLLTNAIYYNKPNGEIHVRTRFEHGAALIAVSDTGQGISATDLPHLFKRFYRADKARSAAAGRNGLGLAICKAIVDVHGGTIEVQSQLGAGTTFIIRLPA